jgi:hypothetical protein
VQVDQGGVQVLVDVRRLPAARDRHHVHASQPAHYDFTVAGNLIATADLQYADR